MSFDWCESFENERLMSNKPLRNVEKNSHIDNKELSSKKKHSSILKKYLETNCKNEGFLFHNFLNYFDKIISNNNDIELITEKFRLVSGVTKEDGRVLLEVMAKIGSIDSLEDKGIIGKAFSDLSFLTVLSEKMSCPIEEVFGYLAPISNTKRILRIEHKIYVSDKDSDEVFLKYFKENTDIFLEREKKDFLFLFEKKFGKNGKLFHMSDEIKGAILKYLDVGCSNNEIINFVYNFGFNKIDDFNFSEEKDCENKTQGKFLSMLLKAPSRPIDDHIKDVLIQDIDSTENLVHLFDQEKDLDDIVGRLEKPDTDVLLEILGKISTEEQFDDYFEKIELLADNSEKIVAKEDREKFDLQQRKIESLVQLGDILEYILLSDSGLKKENLVGRYNDWLSDYQTFLREDAVEKQGSLVKFLVRNEDTLKKEQTLVDKKNRNLSLMVDAFAKNVIVNLERCFVRNHEDINVDGIKRVLDFYKNKKKMLLDVHKYCIDQKQDVFNSYLAPKLLVKTREFKKEDVREKILERIDFSDRLLLKYITETYNKNTQNHVVALNKILIDKINMNNDSGLRKFVFEKSFDMSLTFRDSPEYYFYILNNLLVYKPGHETDLLVQQMIASKYMPPKKRIHLFNLNELVIHEAKKISKKEKILASSG